MHPWPRALFVAALLQFWRNLPKGMFLHLGSPEKNLVIDIHRYEHLTSLQISEQDSQADGFPSRHHLPPRRFPLKLEQK